MKYKVDGKEYTKEELRNYFQNLDNGEVFNENEFIKKINSGSNFDFMSKIVEIITMEQSTEELKIHEVVEQEEEKEPVFSMSNKNRKVNKRNKSQGMKL